MEQQVLFNKDIEPTGEFLRDNGIKKSVEHAEKVRDGWQEEALVFLCFYIRCFSQFSCEQIREASQRSAYYPPGIPMVPEPPSLRSWGSVMLTAAKRGWIKQIGYIHVDNPKAHRANAALWERNI